MDREEKGEERGRPASTTARHRATHSVGSSCGCGPVAQYTETMCASMCLAPTHRALCGVDLQHDGEGCVWVQFREQAAVAAAGQ